MILNNAVIIIHTLPLHYISFLIEPRDSTLENLIGSPPSVKSDDIRPMRKRPLSEEDDSSSSPTKTIKKESEIEEDPTTSEGNF